MDARALGRGFSGGPSGAGVWTYGTNQVTLSGPCTSGGATISAPFTSTRNDNYTLRVNVFQFASAASLTGLAFVVRWTNNTNFVTFLQTAGATIGVSTT